MMNNLFAMFDPSTNSLSLNWLALVVPLLLLWKNYYNFNSRNLILLNTLMKFISKDLKNNLMNKFNINLFLFFSIFFLVISMNMMSIFPFVFAPTSHMVFNMIISFPIWFSLMIHGWSSHPSDMLAHLVPLGTPTLLCPFMVIIETISNLIRPATLAIRLTANIIAGHILISLMSAMLNSNMFMFLSTALLINTLIFLEMAVSFIQGYVFITLMSLYMNES